MRRVQAKKKKTKGGDNVSILIAIKKRDSVNACNGFEKIFKELPKSVTATEYDALYEIYCKLMEQNARNEKDK